MNRNVPAAVPLLVATLSVALLVALRGIAAEKSGDSPSTSAACQVVAPEAQKRAILQVIEQMEGAWNRGDFRGYMQGFKNPGVVFVSGGRFQAGWQGTLEHYIRDYGATAETRGTLRFFNIRIEMLSPDAAQLISQFQLVRPQHPQYGINTRLMRKIDGRWVIALNHVSASETQPPQ
jgi:uncharacterized protein (TIGR02246 family)